MGAWGYESDANDTTQDTLSIDIGLNLYDTKDNKKDSTIIKSKKIYDYFKNNTSSDHMVSYVGALIWSVNHNFKVPETAKSTCKEYLLKELDELKNGKNTRRGWEEPRQRIKAIELEIKKL